ncbi:hypothetical protein BKA93DRAFT_821621 [Sparassis latifolia]|uniref:Uncharacterized protein n=1 Tax=Sparassis crispa TaxID=139825 RepID=A0A401H5A7_9APHY|nr:predicted protein [Sparassis crispa]GBE89602.1 predicted protein [Sparassis crispa]
MNRPHTFTIITPPHSSARSSEHSPQHPPRRMTELVWTIPERRNRHGRLTTLPYDIYNLILDEFRYQPEQISLKEYKSTLATWALVCRLFHHLVVPKLFKTFVSWRNWRSGETPQLDRWVVEMNRGDAMARALAPHVKHLTFEPCQEVNAPLEPRLAHADLSSWTTALRFFTNVVSIRLSSDTIGDRFFTAVATLPKLQVLHMRNCNFRAPQNSFILPLDKLPALKVLEVSGVGNAFWRYIPAIVSLAATRSLRSLITTEWEIARNFFTLDMDIPLEMLQVPLHPHGIDALSTFLDRTPSITDLELIDYTLKGDRHAAIKDLRQLGNLRVKQSSLPRLEKLKCLTHLLPALWQSRPISSLTVVGGRGLKKIICGQQIPYPLEGNFSGNSALRYLVLSAKLYAAYPLAELKLEKLSLYLSGSATLGDPRFMEGMFSLRKQKTTVRKLQLYFQRGRLSSQWALDLQLQHSSILLYLEKVFPTATCISMIESLHWHRSEGRDEWNPIIPERQSFRTVLRDIVGLRKYYSDRRCSVTDFHGVLTRTFKDDPTVAAVLQRQLREYMPRPLSPIVYGPCTESEADTELAASDSD